MKITRLSIYASVLYAFAKLAIAIVAIMGSVSVTHMYGVVGFAPVAAVWSFIGVVVVAETEYKSEVNKQNADVAWNSMMKKIRNKEVAFPYHKPPPNPAPPRSER